ncbi:phosphoglycerol transferase MdoB-like AlkP superfamily enzyme [Rhodoligotrophos appendicifer]|uniref:hypothetical protein n=1 Tax=Rhodoligotrophos appendicifer TaxID=987056 RepID=UPI00117D3C01|nr:hypothetical protein [Rhodoligotrophos appendicifer]
MISSEEFSSALRGAWRLLNRDPGGYQDFQLDRTGLWHSFTAVVIVAPLYLFLMATTYGIQADPPVALSYPHALVGLLLEWAGFVALAMAATRLMEKPHRFTPLVVAYNWSSVLIVTAMIPAALLFRYGLFNANSMIAWTIVINLIGLYYRWYIARTALGSSGQAAAAFVAADVAISLTIDFLVT